MREPPIVRPVKETGSDRSDTYAAIIWVATVTVLHVVSVLLGFGPPFQPFLGLLFVTTCPGFLLIDVAPLPDGATKILAGVGGSLGLNVTIVSALLVGDWYSPVAGTTIIATISLAGAAGLYLSRRRGALTVQEPSFRSLERPGHDPGRPPIKVLMIVGWDRSGSTILANLIGSLGAAVSVGEINNLWERGLADDRRCGCGDVFSECDFWRAALDAAYREETPRIAELARRAQQGLGTGWLIASHMPLIGRRVRARSSQYSALLARLYAAIEQVGPGGLIVDASKTPWHAAAAGHLTDIDVFIVHLVRDPRAVVHSLRKHMAYEPGGPLMMDRHSLPFTAIGWAFRNRLIERIWSGSERYMLVRHEDFVEAPESVVHSILEFCGESTPIRTRSGTFVLTRSHSVSGNPVRFQTGPVAIHLDESWRRATEDFEDRLVRALTWPLMRRYGYGSRRPEGQSDGG